MRPLSPGRDWGPSHNRSQPGPWTSAGGHVRAACVQCHQASTFQDTPDRCVACHEGSDTHAGGLGEDCAVCHAPSGWGEATYDHTLATFPLLGQHQAVPCAQCHADGTCAGTPQTCAACHQSEDRHIGQFGSDCARCHTLEGWQGASIDYSLTRFPLTGRHGAVACAQRHSNSSYTGTPMTCTACHGEPPAHAGLLGAKCANCHNPDGWPPARFDRHHSFPLYRGGSASCRNCHPHTQTTYNGLACHQPREKEEEHREEENPIIPIV